MDFYQTDSRKNSIELTYICTRSIYTVIANQMRRMRRPAIQIWLKVSIILIVCLKLPFDAKDPIN